MRKLIFLLAGIAFLVPAARAAEPSAQPALRASQFTFAWPLDAFPRTLPSQFPSQPARQIAAADKYRPRIGDVRPPPQDHGDTNSGDA